MTATVWPVPCGQHPDGGPRRGRTRPPGRRRCGASAQTCRSRPDRPVPLRACVAISDVMSPSRHRLRLSPIRPVPTSCRCRPVCASPAAMVAARREAGSGAPTVTPPTGQSAAPAGPGRPPTRAAGGRPDSRRAALSSRELAGRGAGRGGSRSAVAIGSTRSGSWPGGGQDRPGEAEPGGLPLVGHVEGARTPVEGQPDHGPGQVGGEGRAAVLVVDEPQRRRRVGGGQPQDRLDHVGAVGAADPGRAHDGGRRRRPAARTSFSPPSLLRP